MIRFLTALAALLIALPAFAAQSFTFDNIDGGTLSLDQWKGRPVLVVNTASQCGFTPQYDGLQALYDRYRDRGLIVLAVPSDDFRQELASEAEVKAFCEVNFDLNLPMTTITHVRGAAAHPLYLWLAAQGFEPNWNFNKALIAPDGRFVAGWGATTRPLSAPVTAQIEALLD
ncbi:glutathione peroxidase [Salipiger sp. P9]|uniref:glutathione peroxidase n=1 Tax=Salipiger pentaromativorans TaxID=2943193 RepID=UPI0021578911|nr:glutathione peroxidase [Salipiger pentaromativorans]MCR8546396.1 glutathione peroxidase [Salipiger pentaromativorans]